LSTPKGAAFLYVRHARHNHAQHARVISRACFLRPLRSFPSASAQP
jgi:hypothetical protein